MSFIAGDILIRMAADVASLKSDMDRAKSAVTDAVGIMKTAAGALGAALSAQMFVGWIRSAIDAGDEMNKLAQRTGIATQDIAGLQLAFRLSGVESGSFATSMAKLSKQVIEGNDAFKILGVETRNADGSIRSVKDVLYDTADAFAGAEDGAAKSALAMEIFGKSGAELIPLLNGGRDSLQRMDEMARKLGLTMSDETAKAAEEFNDTLDLIGMGSQGVARQVAAQLLPTLQNLAGAFLTAMTEGNALAKTADIIAATLKGLFSAALLIVEVFNSIGKTIGAAGAQIVSIMNGDFKQAARIGQEWSSDVRNDWSNTAKTLQKVWGESGDATVKTMTENQRMLRQLSIATKEQEEANKKAAEAAKKHNDELDKAAEAIRLELVGLSGDFVKKLQQLAELRNTNRLTLEEYLKAVDELLKKQPRVKEQLEAEKKALEDKAKADLKAIADYEKREQAIEAATGKAQDMVDGIKQEIAALQMSSIEREISNELLKLEKLGLEKGSAAYEYYAEQVRQAVIDRNTVKQSIDASQAIAGEWKRLAEDIGQGLTDSLYRAFESGKDFFSTLWSGIKNLFKTTVLRLLISPVQTGINAMVGAALGIPGAANAADGAGSIFGNVSGLAGLAGGMGAFGSGIASGLTAWGAGGSVTGLLSSGSSLFAGGVANGLGVIAGALGPIVLGLTAIAALANKFKGETRSGAQYGYEFGNGMNSRDGSITRGQLGVNFLSGPSGGELAGAEVRKAIGGTVETINSLLTGVGSQLRLTGFQAGLETSDKGRGGVFAGGTLTGGRTFGESGIGNNYAGTLFETTSTQSPDGETALKNFSQDLQQVTIQALQAATDIPQSIKVLLEGVNAEALGEEAIAGLLSTIGSMVSSVNRLRDAVASLPMQNLANLSFDAAAGLIELSGGIDNLLGNIQTYVNEFYSAEERAGLSAQAIASALQSVGIDPGTLASREDFRALVESRDAGTEQGREQLAALLEYAGEFASVADYLGETGQTLRELAESGPQTLLLAEMLDPQTRTADATTAIQTSTEAAAATLTTISNQLDGIAQVAQIASDAANAAVGAAQAAVSAANNAANSSAKAAADAALAAAQPSYSYDIGRAR